MVVAIVDYRPQAVSAEEIARRFEASGPLFAGMPGLIRKYYCFDEHRHEGLSVYLWESREAAERCFGAPAFLERFRTSFGCDPEIRYVDARLVVEGPAA